MQKDYDEAVKALEDSLKLNEKNSSAHHFIGLAYKELQLYGFAVRHFLLAIEHDRNHFESYVSLAEVYVERYEFKLAKTTL